MGNNRQTNNKKVIVISEAKINLAKVIEFMYSHYSYFNDSDIHSLEDVRDHLGKE